MINESKSLKTRTQLGVPLFVTTLSMLLLELGLTRLFSAVLFYHYAFLVISIALLGLATGGIAARLIPRDLTPVQHRWWMGVASLVACVSLIPGLWVLLHTDVWLIDSWRTFGWFSLLYVLWMLPFGVAGFIVASAMNQGSEGISSLYFYDLLGASAGCLLFVPLIQWVGGPNVILCVGALWCLAAVLWFRPLQSVRWTGAGAGLGVAILALVGLNLDGAIIDVQFMRGTALKNEVFVKWNSFSRISVINVEGAAPGDVVPCQNGRRLPAYGARVQYDGGAM